MFVPQSSCLGNEFGSSYAGFSRPGSRSARRSGQGVCRERPRPQQLRHGRVGPGRKRRPNGTTSIGRESLPGRGRGKRGQRTRSHGGQSATSPGGMLLRLCAFPDARRVAVYNSVRVAEACLHLPPRISPIIRKVGGFSEISCVSRLDIREAFAATSTPTTCFNKAETSPGSPESGVALAMHYLQINVCAW